MALQDKYINPFTDYAFKKTETELETDFDKWMYVLKHLPHLQNRPPALQERIFQKLFEAAEVARFDAEEKAKYEESLKYYRDLKNVVDTSFEEGREEGKVEKEIELILKSDKAGLDLQTISKITGKSIEEIRKVIEEAER